MQHDPYSAFTIAFIARTKQLREASGRTQEETAIALGLPLGTYRKYEKRSAMPLYLLDRFVTIVQGDLVFLITGREPKVKRRSRAPETRDK
ncbi:MAG: hypothetical protein JWO51_193 [Rhodospirillales bacterium]|nr:hypothetical protein [Rhodospirillales bacterium]